MNDASAQTAKNVTLLLVDDEPSVLNIISRILAKDGFVVLPAATGAAALDILRAQADRVQIAVVDMSMPGMDGAETVAELHKIRPGLPVLVASGLCDEETVSRFAPGSVAAFLQKPYQREILARTIAETLARGA